MATRRKASPKQVAYLSYLGHEGSEQLSSEEASEVIEGYGEIGAGDAELMKRMNEWRSVRYDLYPNLYPEENPVPLIVSRSEERFRSYVRARHTGCSQKLTRGIIEDIVARLLAESRHYSVQQEPPSEVIYDALHRFHPGCVDGPAPVREATEPAPKQPLPEIHRSPVRMRPPRRVNRAPADKWSLAAWLILAGMIIGVIIWILKIIT